MHLSCYDQTCSVPIIIVYTYVYIRWKSYSEGYAQIPPECLFKNNPKTKDVFYTVCMYVCMYLAPVNIYGRGAYVTVWTLCKRLTVLSPMGRHII